MDQIDPLTYFKNLWSTEQLALKKKLIFEKPEWTLDSGPNQLKYVAGLDISFIKGNEDDACAGIVVLSYPDLKVVYQRFKMVKLTLPYIAGFLAFREVDHLVELVEELKTERPDLTPQCLFIDGNGYLHPLGFGVACHLGVLVDIPALGVAKNFLVVDGLDMKETKEKIAQECKQAGDWSKIIGKSGTVWGAGLANNPGGRRPLYISPGHKMDLETSVELVKRCSQVRIPEPIRAADLGSREYLRKLGHNLK